jgi:hypothetical protein
MTRRSSWIPFKPMSPLPKRTQVVYELMINEPEVFTTGLLQYVQVPKPSSWEDLCSSNEIEVVKFSILYYKKFEEFELFAKQAFNYDKEKTLTKRIERLWKIVTTQQAFNVS